MICLYFILSYISVCSLEGFNLFIYHRNTDDKQFQYIVKFKMYRNNHHTQSSFPSWNQNHSQSHYRPGSTTGFGQRTPLYPIGPTLTQP